MPAGEIRAGIIMYQTSYTKGQELVAEKMVKYVNKLGHRAWLITGPYHDGRRVVPTSVFEKSVKGYVEDYDKVLGIPIIRVDGYISTWPPRRIMFRNFIDVLRRIVSDYELNLLITHSTLWNGPEEVVKFVEWWNLVRSMGEERWPIVYGHMSHFQPPSPLRYSTAERALRMAWNRFVFPHVFRVADFILCVTEIEVRHMVDMGARPDQCLLFPGGIDDEYVELLKSVRFEDFADKYDIPKDKKIVAYVGTIEKRKNPLGVIKVAKLLADRQDIYFVLAGYPGDQAKDVEEEARKVKNLKYLGVISESDKAALAKGTYVNIILSYMEALGITQMEFMLAGVPVVTSGVEGQSWLVRDGVDGIHVRGPEDYEGAAMAIRKLADDPKMRDELGNNARRRVESYTFSNLMRSVLDKVAKILESKSTR